LNLSDDKWWLSVRRSRWEVLVKEWQIENKHVDARLWINQKKLKELEKCITHNSIKIGEDVSILGKNIDNRYSFYFMKKYWFLACFFALLAQSIFVLLASFKMKLAY